MEKGRGMPKIILVVFFFFFFFWGKLVEEIEKKN